MSNFPKKASCSGCKTIFATRESVTQRLRPTPATHTIITNDTRHPPCPTKDEKREPTAQPQRDPSIGGDLPSDLSGFDNGSPGQGGGQSDNTGVDG